MLTLKIQNKDVLHEIREVKSKSFVTVRQHGRDDIACKTRLGTLFHLLADRTGNPAQKVHLPLSRCDVKKPSAGCIAF